MCNSSPSEHKPACRLPVNNTGWMRCCWLSEDSLSPLRLCTAKVCNTRRCSLLGDAAYCLRVWRAYILFKAGHRLIKIRPVPCKLGCISIHVCMGGCTEVDLPVNFCTTSPLDNFCTAIASSIDRCMLTEGKSTCCQNTKHSWTFPYPPWMCGWGNRDLFFNKTYCGWKI